MIRIITDSVAGIPASVCDEYGIEVVSLFVNNKNEEFVDAEMDVEEFYKNIYDMIDDIPKSSQPSQNTFIEFFTSAAEAGDEVLGVFISSKLSGTINGALQAARSVVANHANFRFCLIDSCSCGFDEAYGVFAAVAARDAGCTLKECEQQVLESIRSSHIVFVPESLRFLKAGGRIGKASALLGSALKLLPIITVTDGEVNVIAKVRTFKKALGALFERFSRDVEEYGLRNVVVQFIGDSTAARTWAQDVIEPFCGHPVPVMPVSPVIGLHVGPAVGISYECKKPFSDKITPSFDIPVFCA